LRVQSPATAVARTKYRVPRPRGDAVARDALLARLRTSVLANPLTAVVAPAGYGKTTLLAQLAASLDGVPLAWIAVDEDDGDPNRVFASLVRAVEPFGLQFEEDVDALIATVAAGATQSRAAVGALVNALCTSPSARFVIVLDDLHRVAHADVGTLLEALVERLPEHVSLVLAGRSLPALPLARWIVRGEAEEFGPRELGFDAVAADALARARGRPVEGAEIDRLLARTHGWAAGLAMLLRASQHGAAASADSDAHLYDYLAAEVLDGLPADLRRFTLDCAVLAELTPAACAAVAGRDDAAALLRAVLDRDLFVTVLDGAAPVLRFHDLFRDFLRAQLATDGPRLRDLHLRAAQAEPGYARAIGHWIAAGEWEAALARLFDEADALLAEGGHAAVERWLDRFPPALTERDARWQYLRATCAWRRWDWLRTHESVQRAAAQLDESSPPGLRARVLLLLMGARNGLGNRAGALELRDALAPQPLDAAERAIYHLQSAWCHMGLGECARVPGDLRAAARAVARDPMRVGPQTVDRTHSIYIGVPGVQAAFVELLAVYAAARGPGVAPWHGGPAIIEGWVAIWDGDRARAEAAIERAHDVIRRFGGIPPLQDALARLEAMHLGLTGRVADALAIAEPLYTRFAQARAAAQRLAFEGAYLHGYARVAWGGGERAAFLAVAERASRPPRPEEWPVIGVAARAIPGQVALLERDWARAAAVFESVVDDYAGIRCPMGQADPRLGLAHARLQQGRLDDALRALEAVLAECVEERVVGPLLLEPDWLVSPLLDALPARRRADQRLAPLLARLAAWRASVGAGAPAAGPSPRASGPLGRLSDREREVLERVAHGASNKEIARELDLSLHTVKRHIANILGKLDCVSRRQAADLVRADARRA
jgi:LuxR family maltose regulon positive regulatory protein